MSRFESITIREVDGLDSNVSVSTSAELYDPASGTWTVTGSPKHRTRGSHGTLLPNGMVLVAAGESSKKDLSFPVDPDRAPSWSLGVPGAGCCFIFPVASAELYTPGPTPTPTPTITPTPTATASGSPTSTPRPTPTPRSHATPRPRPTPHPRVIAVSIEQK
jgi:hypothetical protein